MHLVERFFADLSGNAIRQGSVASGCALIRNIDIYLAQRDAEPKPFKWRGSPGEGKARPRRPPQDILESEHRKAGADV
jgi:hypothetical protein